MKIPTVKLKNVIFETKNAQTLSIFNLNNFLFFSKNKKKLLIEDSDFENCGNEKMIGGALFLKSINFRIKKRLYFKLQSIGLWGYIHIRFISGFFRKSEFQKLFFISLSKHGIS